MKKLLRIFVMLVLCYTNPQDSIANAAVGGTGKTLPYLFSGSNLFATPDAPTNLVVTPLNTGGMIQFTAPASDGASSITNYEYSIDNGATWITPSPAITSSPIIISSGLTNCTSYQVKIRAINAAGSGTESSAIQLIPATSVDGVGVNWTARTSAADNNWQSVTYGNGLFVAVALSGTGNRVMTSLDGITWTARTSAVDNGWKSVTYGNGLFVAVANTGSGNRVMTSPDGISWTARTSAVDNDWLGITYGNGLFVAVAESGAGNRVMTSPDGITWTARTSAADLFWTSVTYGNSRFVAVAATGSGNRVMTSPDGITWTARTSAVDNTWSSVTYGNGLFVAVSSFGTNRVMTSPDGIIWTSSNAVAEYSWNSVTYGNGLFVAVAQTGTGNRVMSSPDGITWTARTSAADNLWRSITYGNGLFVAVASTGTGNRVMTSSYSVVANPPVISSVDSRNGGARVFFTATSSTYAPSTSNYEYSTDDGVTFTALNPSSNQSPITIGGLTNGSTYGVRIRAVNSVGSSCTSAAVSVTPSVGTVPDAPTNLVATGINTGGMIQFTAPANDGGSSITNYEYSIDGGSNWITPSPAITSSPIIISSGLTNCTSYQVKLRAVNSVGSGTSSSVVQLIPAESVDIGVNWTVRVSAANNQWLSVTYGNGLFVAVAQSGAGNRVMTSPDGIKWTARTSAADNTWTSVTYGNNRFVAVASTGTGNRVMSSPDGITWTAQTSAADNPWTSVTYGNGLFVAVANTGTGNRVMTSPDGITWTARTSAADNLWQSVTYGNGLFVAVGNANTGSNRVMTSPDGINWTIRTSAADNGWMSVTYGNGLFVAVANGGSTGNRVMTSPDGINWTIRTSAADNDWRSVTYGNGLFVAVAQTGVVGSRVMSSPNGITWTIRTAAAFSLWQSVTYGNGLFVAVSTAGNNNRVMTSGYSVVADAPVITAAPVSQSEATISFTQSPPALAPAITNYRYSIDNGSNWTTLSPASTTSPITATGITDFTNQIQLQAINSVGNSCPATYSVVGLNINKYGQKTSTGSEFVNINGALGISGIRATGESRTYAPVISATAAVTDLTATTATSGGTVDADKGFSVTARGVCWSTTTNPTIADNKTVDGTGVGTFTSAITGLASGTTYYVRSYATNSIGTTYGPEIIFITL
jgi:hypothetical protein